MSEWLKWHRMVDGELVPCDPPINPDPKDAEIERLRAALDVAEQKAAAFDAIYAALENPQHFTATKSEKAIAENLLDWVKRAKAAEAALAAAEKRAEFAELEIVVLREHNAHFKVGIADLKADAATLAEECRAWRLWNSLDGRKDLGDVRAARAATDASGALTRHTKETPDA